MTEPELQAGLLDDGGQDGNDDAEAPTPIPTETVTSLLKHRQSDVIKYLQTRGLYKLEEFEMEVRRNGWGGPFREFGPARPPDIGRREKGVHARPAGPTGWSSMQTNPPFRPPTSMLISAHFFRKTLCFQHSKTALI